jgi:hypothetical protein
MKNVIVQIYQVSVHYDSVLPTGGFPIINAVPTSGCTAASECSPAAHLQGASRDVRSAAASNKNGLSPGQPAMVIGCWFATGA